MWRMRYPHHNRVGLSGPAGKADGGLFLLIPLIILERGLKKRAFVRNLWVRKKRNSLKWNLLP